jgi:signal transduction histidine kinase
MIRFSIGTRIRLLVTCLTGLVTLLFACIGWIILLDAEDALHDAYFVAAAKGVADGGNPGLLPAGVSAHSDADFLSSKMNLRDIPAAPGIYEIFANDDLTQSILVRGFGDRLRLWFVLGYEREYRLWIGSGGTPGRPVFVLADLSTQEVSEGATDAAIHKLIFLSAGLFLIALGVSELITRWTLKPLRRLTGLVVGEVAATTGARFHADFPKDEIGQLAAALDDYRSRLEEMLSRERRFLSDCSHELRTPIATITTALDILGTPAEKGANHDHVRERLRRSAHRMERLIRTFLLLARDRTPPVDPEATDLGELVHGVAEEIRALNPRASLVVNLVYPSPTMVRINSEALSILCHNLIGNAYLHVGEGKLEITVRRQDQSISIVFTDDGPGLPDNPSSYARGGNGIGLTLVERVCKACGWSFHKGSSSEGGAKLEIIMPA